MKIFFLTVLLTLVITGSNAQTKNEMEKKKIETLISGYATAIDAANAEAAGQFLDSEFRVVLNNFNNSGTVTILTKSQYLGMITDGKAGGTRRQVSFLLTDIHENAAVVKVRLESDRAVFTNYYSLVNSNGQWLIVTDIPQFVTKQIK